MHVRGCFDALKHRLEKASATRLTSPWRSAVFKLLEPIPGSLNAKPDHLGLHVIDFLLLPVPSVVVRYDPTVYTKAAVARLLAACGLPVGDELEHRAGSLDLWAATAGR